jgi:hypothetical protein
MGNTLEDFLAKTRRDLASLTEEERERRLDVVSDQLARYLATRLAQGLDEEEATVEAIRQFEAQHHSALYAGVGADYGLSRSLPPVAVAVLYCIVANKGTALLLGLLFHLIASCLSSPFFAQADLLLAKSNPSMILAVAAAVILLLRDGLPKIVSTLASSRTIEGSGARWTALNQAFIFVLGLVLLLLFRGSARLTAAVFDISTNDVSPIMALTGLALLLLMLASPFAAGWIVARAAPRAGMWGVWVAAITSSLLSFMDQCSWLFS